jgi:hypothetical protein
MFVPAKRANVGFFAFVFSWVRPLTYPFPIAKVKPEGAQPQMKPTFRYHHLGIPTRKKVSGLIEVRRLKIHVTDHESNPFGIQWMLYGKNCKVPDLVRKTPHAAFEVNDLKAALKGKKIIIKPNSPSPGVLVAFIEVAGAPIELLQFTAKRTTPPKKSARRV